MSDDAVKSERYAFEPFGSLDGVLQGNPIRIFPTGKWYRDKRTLDLSPQRLQEFSRNIKAGLPQFEIPINLEHDKSLGRYGSIHDLEYIENGPDGSGLYATKYDLTPEGRKLLEQQKFKGVSGEAVWTLNSGAKYQDPRSGELVDNVLVGMALTNSSFFGKEVALFSAAPEVMQMTDGNESIVTRIKETLSQLLSSLGGETTSQPETTSADDFAVWSTAFMNDLPDSCFLYIESGGEKDADGKTTPRSLRHFPFKDASGKVDLPHLRNALARIPQSSLPADVKDRIAAKARRLAADAGIETSETTSVVTKEIEIMSDETKTTTSPPETLAITPDEFAALRAKAEKAEQLETQVTAIKQQAEQFAADLRKVTHARRHDQLLARYEAFVALPEKPATLADKMQALEEYDAKLFDYFDALLKQLDGNLMQAGLFNQIGDGRGGEQAETLEAFTDQLVREKFSGDMGKYAEAFEMAQKQRPDLVEAYRFRGRR